MEAHETLLGGAEREALEEAACKVKATSLLALLDVPRIAQTMAWFRARFEEPAGDASLRAAGPVGPDVDSRFDAAHETDEATLFPVSQLPWEDLAFPTTRIALESFLQDPGDEDGAGGTVYKVVTEMPPGLGGES